MLRILEIGGQAVCQVQRHFWRPGTGYGLDDVQGHDQIVVDDGLRCGTKFILMRPDRRRRQGGQQPRYAIVPPSAAAIWGMARATSFAKSGSSPSEYRRRLNSFERYMGSIVNAVWTR